MSAEITVNDYIEKRPNSMFISNVLEEEVINIVNKVKSKTSLDNDNINMKIVKEVITQIAIKMGKNIFSQTIDQFHFFLNFPKY